MYFSLLILSILFPSYSAEHEDMNKNAGDQPTDTNKKEEEDEEEEDEEEEESQPGSTLFIKNLNYSTTEESLKEVGSEFTEPRLRVGLRGAGIVRRVRCPKF